MVGKKIKEQYFVIWKHIKFTLLCPSIKVYWSRQICDLCILTSAAFAQWDIANRRRTLQTLKYLLPGPLQMFAYPLVEITGRQRLWEQEQINTLLCLTRIQPSILCAQFRSKEGDPLSASVWAEGQVFARGDHHLDLPWFSNTHFTLIGAFRKLVPGLMHDTD